MHPAICQLLFVIVYYSKSHGTSLRYQKAQYPPPEGPHRVLVVGILDFVGVATE